MLHLRRIVFLLFIFFTSITLTALPARPLVQELKRLNVNTVLLREAAIDDWPLWSPDGRFVCINDGGKWWVKVDLDVTSLSPSTWLGRTIGSNSVETVEELPEEERERFRETTKYDPRSVSTAKGDKIELVMESDFGVSLRINSKRIWKTSGDNCHSLSLSPDEKYVAFISESNGLMLMDISDAYKTTQLSPEATLMNTILNQLNSGKTGKGIKTLDKALVQYPGHSEFWYTKSLIYFSEGDSVNAHACVDSAIARVPENFNYVYYKAMLYQLAGDYANAITWIDKYIAMRPHCLYGYYMRAETHEKKGDRESACADYRAAEARHSTRAVKKVKALCR